MSMTREITKLKLIKKKKVSIRLANIEEQGKGYLQ